METKYPILLVDDRPDFLKMFQKTFEDDFTFLACESAAQAMELLANRPEIAVVMSDQRMPETQGADFLIEVRSRYPEVVRILITAYSDLDPAVKAINEGRIFQYIQKPFEDEKVKQVLTEAIEEHKTLVARKHQEEETRRLIRERSIEMVRQFAAGIAHHFNNPLSSVYTFLQLFPVQMGSIQDKGGMDEGFWNFSKQALKDCEKMSGLIDFLLEITQASVAHFMRVPVEELVALHDFNILNRLKEKKIELVKEIAPDLPELFVDLYSCQRLVEELLRNAIEASPEKGKITLRIEKNGNIGEIPFARIEVIDQGKGFPPEKLKMVFDPYFNADFTSPRQGLGLTWCQFTVYRHGGEVQVRSLPGKETVFSFILPFLRAEEEISAA